MKRLRQCIGLCLIALVIGGFGFDRWVARTTLPYLALETSKTVLDANGELLRAYAVADGRWRLPVTIDQVDPNYLQMLVTFEDKRFYTHNGVDPRAMLRAFWQAAWNGRIVSGGSTLTMQVARLLEAGETGKWSGKLRQFRLALALERRLSKDEILNLYLLLAPMGGNIEGVRAASLTYFGKEPNRLTPAESALLVALPQAPTSRRPDRYADAAQIARDRVLRRAVGAGILPMDEAIAAFHENVPDSRIRFAILAPHLSDRLLAADPATNIYHTTLDRDLQASIETLLQSAVKSQSNGVSAAMIIADHQTGAILASAGSSGFFDTRRRGFIDMTQAVRSPGSTLKPFIYGLAFESGLAHPETIIQDRPMQFGGYAPQNFDKSFRGAVHIRTALQLSLNIPAVAVLDAVGPAQFLDRLRRAGINPQLPPGGTPGLAIALGGIGLSLHDLVTLYAALARGGEPIEISPTNSQSGGNPVMLSGAAWQVADILADTPPPNTASLNRIAYKTGTSYGYRDAWAIGFDGQHVIGVWLGRPNGASVPGIQGLADAAPILFQAFSRLKELPTPLAPPPRSVLTVGNSQLPPPLQSFRARGDIDFVDLTRPEISFPPDGAEVDLGLSSGNTGALVIKLSNGTPPFNWIINGERIGDPGFERQTIWTTESGGFVTISVIDSLGRAARAQVFLQ